MSGICACLTKSHFVTLSHCLWPFIIFLWGINTFHKVKGWVFLSIMASSVFLIYRIRHHLQLIFSVTPLLALHLCYHPAAAQGCLTGSLFAALMSSKCSRQTGDYSRLSLTRFNDSGKIPRDGVFTANELH